MTVSPELRIRRLKVDEALPMIDPYLNAAFISELETVRIVHGKGTGTLRKVVHEVLAKHPLVKSFRLGDYNEGSYGVTIVELSNH